MSTIVEQTYFYGINYPQKEKLLCQLEMKTLFGRDISKKYIFSPINVDPSRSPFIKFRITLFCTASSEEELVQYIIDKKLAYDNFKFTRFKFDQDTLDYASWLKSVTALGFVITGPVDMKNPTIELAILRVDDLWVFGIYEKSQIPWEKHFLKPCNSSNSLETRTARAIVNIAVGHDTHLRLVDPCCGVGTVVLEALSLGVPVTGYEISWLIAKNAKLNVSHFGYEPCIIKGDMHDISESYDVAILDLPYGLFSPITYAQQKKIITTARRITYKLVIITSIDMDEDITEAGFTIVDSCTVNKSMFVRYIRVCY